MHLREDLRDKHLFLFRSPSVSLPTPFRYAGKLQGWQEYWDLSQSESMRIKAILEEDFSERHAQLDWDSCMGLHETHFFIWAMRVTSVLRRAWDEFKTSPKQVSVTSLNSSSVPLPFPFRSPSVMRVKLMPLKSNWKRFHVAVASEYFYKVIYIYVCM